MPIMIIKLCLNNNSYQKLENDLIGTKIISYMFDEYHDKKGSLNFFDFTRLPFDFLKKKYYFEELLNFRL